MERQTRSLAGTTEQRVAAALRDQILDGTLPVGTHLRQDIVSAEFGVSSTPVREAFRRLAAEGIVSLSSHRGAIVRDLTLAERLEVMELLRIVENHNVRDAVAAITEADIDAAAAIQGQLRVTDDRIQWALLNSEFHWTLDRSSGRPRTLTLLHELLTLSSLHIRDESARHGRREQALTEHDRILAAFRARDAEAAAGALYAHGTIPIDWLRTQIPDPAQPQN